MPVPRMHARRLRTRETTHARATHRLRARRNVNSIICILNLWFLYINKSVLPKLEISYCIITVFVALSIIVLHRHLLSSARKKLIWCCNFIVKFKWIISSSVTYYLLYLLKRTAITFGLYIALFISFYLVLEFFLYLWGFIFSLFLSHMSGSKVRKEAREKMAQERCLERFVSHFRSRKTVFLALYFFLERAFPSLLFRYRASRMACARARIILRGGRGEEVRAFTCTLHWP